MALRQTRLTQIAALMGCDAAQVRLVVDRSLAEHGALGAAQGDTIRLSPDAPDLDSPAGAVLLGHELAHLMQQRGGRASLDRTLLEDEADRAGFSCAARLFPGCFTDPGMPPALVATREKTRGAMPVQFLISSAASFADFCKAGYMDLQGTRRFSAPLRLNSLYNLAVDYNPLDRAPKTALGGRKLYDAMIAYVTATVPHKIVMQASPNWRDLTDVVDTFVLYYDELAQAHPQMPILPADKLTSAYLHVYPQDQAKANWRIGLNIVPADMAPAMGALTPLLDRYPDIDHMKFLGPASAGKADSVIVYLRYNQQRYAALKQAVLGAVTGLGVQARVGAMWNEIADGIGEASEPPAGGVSFTEYRCLVFYLAYREYWRTAKAPGFDAFKLYLAQAMALFGLDPASPHTQGPLLTGNTLFPSWWRSLKQLKHAWDA